MITFIINQDVCDGLDEQKQFSIQTACQANVALTAAEGEAKQLQQLADLEAAGVTVQRWNDEMMNAFRGAWDDVVAEQSAADPDFKRAWESLLAFRADFAKWSDLAYVK